MNETIQFSDEVLDDPVLREYDSQAVRRFMNTGEEVEDIVRARVWARANRSRERIFEKHGYVDTESLRRPTMLDDE